MCYVWISKKNGNFLRITLAVCILGFYTLGLISRIFCDQLASFLSYFMSANVSFRPFELVWSSNDRYVWVFWVACRSLSSRIGTRGRSRDPFEKYLNIDCRLVVDSFMNYIYSLTRHPQSDLVLQTIKRFRWPIALKNSDGAASYPECSESLI